MLGIMASMDQRDSYVSRWSSTQTIELPQLQFIDKVIDDPVVRVQVLPDRSHARCVQRHVPVVQTAADSRSCSSSRTSTTPVVVQRHIPMVLATIDFPQLRVDTVVDASICRSCRFPFPSCLSR